MKPGTVLGKYKLESPIGKGGFGQVFRATQLGPGGFSRPVAIKMLRDAAQLSPEALEMFAREARIIARLRHRNVVPVHEFACQGGMYFLVMELVEGITARALLRKFNKELPLWLGVAIGLEVCRGLQYAHELTDEVGKPLGIIHRDVKPSNILISTQGEVKLSDFGMAKMSLVQSDQFTARGVVKGTPAYMSPEQRAGDTATGASDIYSLAKVIYEICTGLRPDGEAEGTQWPRIPAPSATNPQIPQELDLILLQALDHDPSCRPTAQGLGRQLQRILTEVMPAGLISRLNEELAQWVHRRIRLDTPEPEGLKNTMDVGTQPHEKLFPAQAGRGLGLEPDATLPTVPDQPAQAPAAQEMTVTLSPPSSTTSHTRGEDVPTRSRPDEGQVFAPRVVPAGPAESGTSHDSTPARSDTADVRDPGIGRPLARPLLLTVVFALLAAGVMVAMFWPQAPSGARGAAAPDTASSPLTASLAPPDAAAGQAPARPDPDLAPVAAQATRLPVRRDASDGDRARRPDARRGARRASGVAPRPRPPTRPPAGRPELSQPPANGFLSVNADPWAEVYLDGRRIGTTPVFKHRVAAGAHVVRLVSPDGASTTKRVTILPNESSNLGKVQLK